MSSAQEHIKQDQSSERPGLLEFLALFINSGDMNTSRRSATFSQISIENGLHQAVALSAMTLLVTAHRAIMNTGFTFHRSGLSTDAVVSLTVGLITTAWTTVVIISGLFVGQRPCRSGVEVCLARLAYAPWMMHSLFLFWLIAFLHEILYIEAKERMERSLKPALKTDEEARKQRQRHSIFDRIICSDALQIWRMKSSRGALDWAGSVDWKFRWVLYTTMILAVSVTAYGAIRAKLYVVGMLNLVGLVLFILGAGGANKYANAPHLYSGDMLRVVLETRHKEGTVYILPHCDRGFDAVWSPKIDYEHREVDEGSPLSAQPHEVRPRQKGEIRSFDLRLAAFNTASELTAKEVNDLATWLYTPEAAPIAMRKIVCARAPGLHLISTSLMIALWHAEYLVFMQRHLLRPELLRLVGTLRTAKLSGMDIEKSHLQIVNRRGMEGYQDAVRYIYRLFDEPMDPKALNPIAAPPKTSEVLPTCPDTIDAYVAALWDYCIEKEESIFAALHMFCFFWTHDIGSDAASGWHGFALRARDREGDMVSWHAIWRQAWYGVVISQLTSMSPIILSAFVAGVLQ